MREHARRNPIGAGCAAALAIALYVIPTYAMSADIGWWSTLLIPAMLTFCVVWEKAITFLTSL